MNTPQFQPQSANQSPTPEVKPSVRAASLQTPQFVVRLGAIRNGRGNGSFSPRKNKTGPFRKLAES